jgi:hypothetical protein
MFTRVIILRWMLFPLLCGVIGCVASGHGYAPLTHVASLRNIGKHEVYDAILYFGLGGYKVGILPPGAGANMSRTGDDIPENAGAEWRRADGSIHKGTVRIEKPAVMDKRERYVIQINDNDSLSLSVEIPEPIQSIGG